MAEYRLVKIDDALWAKLESMLFDQGRMSKRDYFIACMERDVRKYEAERAKRVIAAYDELKQDKLGL